MIFLKENFIDAVFCEQIIQTSRTQGASKIIYDDDNKMLDQEYRKSQKLELPEALLRKLTKHLQEILPEVKSKIKLNDELEIEKIRGLKYEEGDFFKRHRDVGKQELLQKEC
jgi:peptidyl-tRNA hydrolase